MEVGKGISEEDREGAFQSRREWDYGGDSMPIRNGLPVHH